MLKTKISGYGLLQVWLLFVAIVLMIGAVTTSGVQGRNMGIFAAVSAVSFLCSAYVRRRDER